MNNNNKEFCLSVTVKQAKCEQYSSDIVQKLT